MRSEATTVDDYLASLPPQRRAEVARVREVIVSHLPSGYEEVMNWGMITYQVPLAVQPDTYNGKPLMYAALASQKNHMAVYLQSVYIDPDAGRDFVDAYRTSGRRLDMGKSCVRFTTADDLPLDLLARTIAAVSVEDFVQLVDSGRRSKR